jgi:SAM-dependent MidA family methyltransferase
MEGRIGWSGDFYTSSDVHPILARALAAQVRQIDEVMGHPDPFTVVEIGPGKGFLARDFLADCASNDGGLWSRLRYILIERSPAMRAAQERSLAPYRDRVEWISTLRDIPSGSLTGTILSNELVDAFPVHRLRMERGLPREIVVDVENEGFVECLQELTSPELARYLERLAAVGVTLAEGSTAEINLLALEWMTDVAYALTRGVVITIDYGHTAQDLYAPERSGGTLLCYKDQLVSEDPYQQVGLQDMTAHVDFTSLAAAGEEAGLHVTGFTNQMSFLIGLGVESLIETLEPGSEEFQSIIHLLRPEGMGRTFKVLVQHKGMTIPTLDGLKYRPFFGTALTADQSASAERERSHV